VKLGALILAAVPAAALVVAGCGGGSSSGGGGEPASLAPKDAPVFIEANLAPSAKESEALNQLADTLVGIEDVGGYIVEKLEGSPLGEEKVDYEKEVEPWLGEKAGMYLTGYESGGLEDATFHRYGAFVETTDPGEAEGFLEKRAEKNPGSEALEFEGDKYWSNPTAAFVGVVGNWIVFAPGKSDFEEIVKASEGGEGLNESAKFKQATAAASTAGLGSVYVDIGGLIEEAKGTIDAETEAGFALLGIEPRNATAFATVAPHSEQLEVDLTTDVTKATAPGGDASALLESLPATAVLGFASPEFGKTFGEGVQEFSAKGVPGQLEPGELEAAFESLGINIEQLAASIGNVGGFVEGTSMGSLGGAVVIATDSATEAKNTVSNVGLLLRAAGTKGVTAVGGNLAGFSVHSAKLGPKPLIVGAAGEEIVIAYGPHAAAQALHSQAGTLGSTADFEAAKGALGSTPISAFVVGGPALQLVEVLLSPAEQAEFAAARPYLRKITYAAVGSESKGAATTAKVIIGLQK
jgi:Protein of unknown function (DUF3352)